MSVRGDPEIARLWEQRMRREPPEEAHGKYCYPRDGRWVEGAKCRYIRKGKEAACRMGFFHGADCEKGYLLKCKSITKSMGQTTGESINYVLRPKECKDYTIPLPLQYKMGFGFGVYVSGRGEKISKEEWKEEIRGRCEKCGFRGELWDLLRGPYIDG